ncbi:recombination protein, phage associated [Bacillus thuringiensis serovar andalousiensis BGSC 4AW1]|nr:recombination protein, phage associated [Bacillus thuringiensis serovar andalousiensis BGSC 4AW1]
MKMIHAKITHVATLTQTEKQMVEETLKNQVGFTSLSEISSQSASKAIQILSGWETQYSQAG